MGLAKLSKNLIDSFLLIQIYMIQSKKLIVMCSEVNN